MADDKIVRCRNWMRKVIDAPNVDGWQNMVDIPDDDFTDPDFVNDVDIYDDEIKRKDFDNRYPEYVKKVMLTIREQYCMITAVVFIRCITHIASAKLLP